MRLSAVSHHQEMQKNEGRRDHRPVRISEVDIERRLNISRHRGCAALTACLNVRI
jgi:hypothetical protein